MEFMQIEPLKTLLANKQYGTLRTALIDLEPIDVSDFLTELSDDELVFVFRLLPKDLAAEIFVEMDTKSQETLISAFSDRELHSVINELFADDVADMLEEMPANVVRRIIRNADSSLRQSVNELLCYPHDSAGSVMTTEFVDLSADMTVAEAFEHIRATGPDKETVYTCYIIDDNRHLIGVIDVRTMLLAEPQQTVGELMIDNPIFALTIEERASVVRKFERYDLLALPVTDGEQRLIGIVTVDDAIDVMQEETNEDFAKMAAMAPAEAPYLATPVFTHARNRILWLLILMLSATFTGLLITRYETAFEAIPMLVSFIPMLMDTGGNCGAQSSTMVIRALATDEIVFRDYFRVLFKELRISLCISVVLVVVNTARVLLMYGADSQMLKIALVLGITLACAVMMAKILGCSLPMLAKRCGLDPAIMASPLITTIVDACSVLIYFNVASTVLSLS